MLGEIDGDDETLGLVLGETDGDILGLGLVLGLTLGLALGLVDGEVEGFINPIKYGGTGHPCFSNHQHKWIGFHSLSHL